VYGYSQSATVATVEKRFLAQNPVPGTTVGFNLIADPNRPDGGILERFAGLGIDAPKSRRRRPSASRSGGAWRPQQAGLVDCGRVQEFLGEDARRGWRRCRLDRRRIAESAAG
jgi:hypothetical protein